MSDERTPKKTTEPRNVLNSSGFAFQLRVEQEISSGSTGWTVLGREYPWQSAGKEGFIDLLIAQRTLVGIIECKRPLDTSWTFILPEQEDDDVSVSRLVGVMGMKGKGYIARLGGVDHLPISKSAEFCVSQNSKSDAIALEKICSDLLNSVNALLAAEAEMVHPQKDQWTRLYMPIVVTTAKLYTCPMAYSDVDLATGISRAQESYKLVPYIRFEKTFGDSEQFLAAPTSLDEASVEQRRSVWIVNAAHIADFLTEVIIRTRNHNWDAMAQELKSRDPGYEAMQSAGIVR